MMLPSDLCLIEDPEFKQWVTTYAEDEEVRILSFQLDCCLISDLL